MVRCGGVVFVAAISRWAARLDAILRQRLCETIPGAEAGLATSERTGRLQPLQAGAFCGFTHRPRQLRSELLAADFDVVDVICMEGPAFLLPDLADRLTDDEARRVVMDTTRALERVPELLGIGLHLLATARKR